MTDQEEQIWFDQLLETTRDAFISINRRGIITLFNHAAERMFGYERLEVLGEKVNVLMSDPYRSQHDGYLESYARTGEKKAIGLIRSVEAQRKNGEVFPIELSVTEVSVRGQGMYAAFIRDISDKAQLQAQLVERERLAAIGTTSSTLAHEIGNPLNNLLLNTRLLTRKLERLEVRDEGVLRTLATVSGEISRLQNILDEFRDFARRTKVIKQSVDCKAFLTELHEALHVELEARSTEFRLRVEPDLPSIDGDPQKLKQAMLNLIKNASEAIGKGGVIEIQAELLGTMIRVTVRDNGPGVPEGINIFEPFCTTKIRGTGLGLPVTKQIIERHGGRIDYHNLSEGCTAFRVWLPIAAKEVDGAS